MANEREILTEFIELYRHYPCLWDKVSEEYKDKNIKNKAWEALMLKLRPLEPEANIATAKKKIEHMRSAYNRELKKVNESRRSGCKTSDVHVPNLWYFKLFSFVSKKSKRMECRSDSDPIASDDDTDFESRGQFRAETSSKVRKRSKSCVDVDQKKQKIIEPTQKPLELEQQQHSVIKQTNSFGIYVGEQLDQVSMFQRQVAEKLIAEVIFLAKTENLRFDSKIETPSTSRLLRPTSPPLINLPQVSSPHPFQYIELRENSPCHEEANDNSNEGKTSLEINYSNDTKVFIESSSSSLLKELLSIKRTE